MAIGNYWAKLWTRKYIKTTYYPCTYIHAKGVNLEKLLITKFKQV